MLTLYNENYLLLLEKDYNYMELVYCKRSVYIYIATLII